MRGFFHVSIDKILEIFVGIEVTHFTDTLELLDRRKPFKNYLQRDAYDKINRAKKWEL